MPFLAFVTYGTAVADTDLVNMSPAGACGFLGCACDFSVVGASAAPSTATSPRREVGDDGKETGDLGFMRREGGKEGRIGYGKPLQGVVLLDGIV